VKRKVICRILAIVKVMVMGLFSGIAVYAAGVMASPTEADVLVDGEPVAFDAYNIRGYNYFRLRDLAFALNGTQNQFSVGFDAERNEIILTSGEAYQPDGSEMQTGGTERKEALPTSQRIILDGNEISPEVYNIGGSNYFRLRDMADAIGFYVGFDEAQRIITVDTVDTVNAIEIDWYAGLSFTLVGTSDEEADWWAGSWWRELPYNEVLFFEADLSELPETPDDTLFHTWLMSAVVVSEWDHGDVNIRVRIQNARIELPDHVVRVAEMNGVHDGVVDSSRLAEIMGDDTDIPGFYGIDIDWGGGHIRALSQIPESTVREGMFRAEITLLELSLAD